MDLMQVYKEQPKQKRDNEGRNLALAAATMGLVAAAAPMVGLPMLAAGAGVGAAGAGLYGMTRPQPKQPGSESNIGYSQSTIQRRLAIKDPVGDLTQAQLALNEIDMPDEQKLEYLQPINQALEKYKTRYT